MDWWKGWLLRSGAFPPCGVSATFDLDGGLQNFGHSVRVEWLEWRKGWLLRSGAFPLPECPRALN